MEATSQRLGISDLPKSEKPADSLIPFNVPFLDEQEVQAAVAAVQQKALGGNGAYTHQVEQALKEMTNSPYAFFVTSCTHAMELALMALGIKPGDEVVLPSFTFTSTATCIVRQGAVPVFADIDPTTWCLDPEDVARSCGPKTRAILAVHYAGHPAPIRRIASVAPSSFVLEDAAHAFGAEAGGQAAGTLGDGGCFSFHITKNLTCGEGGALLLRSKEVAQRAEMMREKGTNRAQFLRKEVPRYSWVSEGSSFVASDLLAAILAEQFKKREHILQRRGEIWRRYHQAFAPLAEDGLLTLPVIEPGVQSSYHIFAVLIPPKRQAGLVERLRARGIEASSHYVPLHTSPFWRQVSGGRQRPLPVTERIGSSLLRLPIYPSLTVAQQERVIEVFTDLLKEGYVSD